MEETNENKKTSGLFKPIGTEERGWGPNEHSLKGKEEMR